MVSRMFQCSGGRTDFFVTENRALTLRGRGWGGGRESKVRE